ncbi:MAG: ABC transporter substrate-binding protein [Oscillospiraceae bacterium]|nr:ABC transporter substrate-binding protein [Oscillospiraceae bacterium]
MRKNRIYAGLLAVSLLCSLTACGTQSEANEPEPAAQAQVSEADNSAADDAGADDAGADDADEANAEDKNCCDEPKDDCCADVADCCGDAADAAALTGELEKTSFEIGHLNSTAHLLVFVAKEEGYFEEEGLDATLTLFSSAGELATGLESGKLDVALIGSVPSLTFQSQGHDLTIFGGAMTNGHGYVIKKEFTEGTDAKGVELLKGRNVASVKNSVQDAELQILLKNADIAIGEGEDEVNIVYFDSQKDAYAALANSTIDAASVYSPYASLAESQGYEIVYRCSEEEALENQPCCRQVAFTENLNSAPNAFVAFERALIKAYKFSQENEEGTIKDVKAYIDIEEDLIRTEVYGGYGTSNPDPDKQGTAALKDSIVALGYTEDYDIDSKYNTDVYSKALDSILAENPDDPIYKGLKEHFDQYE